MAENEDKTAEAKKAEAKAAEAKAKAEEKSKADAETKAKAKEEAASNEGLVKMHKDGTDLHVHPTTVEAHKAAGWNHA